MKNSKLRLKNPLAIILATSLALNLFLWLLVWLLFPHDNPSAVLHYNIDVGIDFVGEGAQIIVLPAAGLILLAGNSLLGAVLRPVDKRAAWLLWTITPIVQLILISAFLLVWQANI